MKGTKQRHKLNRWIGLLLAVLILSVGICGCRKGQSGATDAPQTTVEAGEQSESAAAGSQSGGAAAGSQSGGAAAGSQSGGAAAGSQSGGESAGSQSGGAAAEAQATGESASGQSTGKDAEQSTGKDAEQSTGKDTEQSTGKEAAQAEIDEHGVYTSKDDVALYIHTFGKLPENFITKKEAQALGWQGGSLEPYAPGKCIGGGYFGNYEGTLPDGDYRECDIDTLGRKSRGAKRLVYSDDGRIYYTDDHYETFTQLY